MKPFVKHWIAGCLGCCAGCFLGPLLIFLGVLCLAFLMATCAGPPQ